MANFVSSQVYLLFVRAINRYKALEMKHTSSVDKKSMEQYKAHSTHLLAAVHFVLTMLLFVAMTHVQMQLNRKIERQEREHRVLQQMLRNCQHIRLRNSRVIDKLNNDRQIQERGKPTHKIEASKVRA